MNEVLCERSPQKWKTMYRDQYRKFTDSPQREPTHESNEDFHQTSFPIGSHISPVAEAQHISSLEGDAARSPPNVNQSNFNSDLAHLKNNEGSSLPQQIDSQEIKVSKKSSKMEDGKRRVQIFQDSPD